MAKAWLQMFVRAKDYQMNGKESILIISPLVSIILKRSNTRHEVNRIFSRRCQRVNMHCVSYIASAEKVREKTFRQMPIDQSSPPYHNSSSCLNAWFAAVFHFLRAKLTIRNFVALSNAFRTMTFPLGFRMRTWSWALDLPSISTILQKLDSTSASCSAAAAAAGVTYSV